MNIHSNLSKIGLLTLLITQSMSVPLNANANTPPSAKDVFQAIKDWARYRFSSPPKAIPILYGVSENQGSRPYMEDRYDIKANIEKTSRSPAFSYAAIFDGHGGSKAAEYLKNNLYKNLRVSHGYRYPDLWLLNLISGKEDIIYFDLTFEFTNDKMRDQAMGHSGSTAVVTVITADSIYTAHVGDSRAVGSNGQALTEDHTGKNQREIARVGAANIVNVHGVPRLGGQLMVTRAFGDFDLECYGLTAKPELHRYNRADFDFIILGSDGIWDVVGNQEAADYVKQRFAANVSPERVARELVIIASQKSIEQFTKIPVPALAKVMQHELATVSDTDLFNDELFPSLKYAHDNQTIVIIKLR